MSVVATEGVDVVIIAVACVAGAASALLWPSAPGFFCLLFIAAGTAAWRCAAWRRPFCVAVFFFVWSGAWAAWTLAPRVVEPATALVDGCIVSPVLLDDNRISFVLRTMRFPQRTRALRLTVRWYDPVQIPRVGECWRLRLKVRPVRGLLNRYGFDAQRRAFTQGVHGTATVKDGTGARRMGTTWRTQGLEWRLGLAGRLQFVAGEGHTWPLLVALTVGFRYGLDVDDWAVLQRTGTGHLIAISGLHIGLIATLGFGLGRFVLAPVFGACGAASPARASRTAWASALLFATTYAALAGFSLPTSRALIMTCVLAAAAVCRVRIARPDVLSMALILVVLWRPFSVIEAGTWLSFGAVAVLMTLGERAATSLLAAQRVVFVGLFPVLASFIGNVAWISPLANAVFVPLFSVFVIPLTLLGALAALVLPSFAGWLFGVLSICLEWAWLWLLLLPATPFVLPAPTPWRVVVAVAGVALALTVAVSWRARLVTAAACLPLLLARDGRPAHGTFLVEVYDVGQALAVSVRTSQHTLIYDTGARWRRSDAGTSIVLPQLRAAGVAQVDAVVVSHADLDHRGGVDALRDVFGQSRWMIGERTEGAPSSARLCRAGDRWRWDGVTFSFDHPAPGLRLSGNNASCVLRVTGRDTRALITGDIEALAELSMLYGQRVARADLLVGQHHGSATSSTAAFTAAVAPRWVVFSTGYDNQWSLPSQAVIERFEGQGAQVFNTARDGAITVHPGAAGSGRQPSRARVERAAVWRRP